MVALALRRGLAEESCAAASPPGTSSSRSCARTWRQYFVARNSSSRMSVPATVSVPSSDIAWALTWKSGSAVSARSPSSSHSACTECKPRANAVRVREHHRLGLLRGRPRREDQLGEVVGLDTAGRGASPSAGEQVARRGSRPRSRRPPRRRPCAESGHVDRGARSSRVLGLGEDQPRLGHLEDVLRPRRRVGDVRRDEHRGARRANANHAISELGAVVQVDDDEVALRDAVLGSGRPRSGRRVARTRRTCTWRRSPSRSSKTRKSRSGCCATRSSSRSVRLKSPVVSRMPRLMPCRSRR